MLVCSNVLFTYTPGAGSLPSLLILTQFGPYYTHDNLFIQIFILIFIIISALDIIIYLFVFFLFTVVRGTYTCVHSVT